MASAERAPAQALGAQRVTCRGLHPDPRRRRDPRRRQEPCGRLLAIVPGPIRFIGLAPREPAVPDGLLYVLCTRSGCHQWNVFELLTTPAA
jgi:hypothetical protein